MSSQAQTPRKRWSSRGRTGVTQPAPPHRCRSVLPARRGRSGFRRRPATRGVRRAGAGRRGDCTAPARQPPRERPKCLSSTPGAMSGGPHEPRQAIRRCTGTGHGNEREHAPLDVEAASGHPGDVGVAGGAQGFHEVDFYGAEVCLLVAPGTQYYCIHATGSSSRKRNYPAAHAIHMQTFGRERKPRLVPEDGPAGVYLNGVKNVSERFECQPPWLRRLPHTQGHWQLDQHCLVPSGEAGAVCPAPSEDAHSIMLPECRENSRLVASARERTALPPLHLEGPDFVDASLLVWARQVASTFLCSRCQLQDHISGATIAEVAANKHRGACPWSAGLRDGSTCGRASDSACTIAIDH
mmetsp:Transcript_95764/g.310288  ORF Transcript_95764/g.310288 Transcript_95764/m.310288 type:complete len:354 (-) Transcript_95764:25-1086(-)